MKMEEYALVVAGGKGTRIKSHLPKQFLEVAGLPVLMHTLHAFNRYSSTVQIILVLPEDDFGLWKDLCQRYDFQLPHRLQAGGETRFQSVKKGLEQVPGNSLVCIHDGVRPLVHENLIAASFRLAAIHGSAVAAVRLKESIRMIDQDKTQALDRSRFRLIQTPQTFQSDLIKKAYQVKEDSSLTDDASVAERAGHTISLFEGSYENIKITTAEDLVIADALLQSHKK
ncbi:MAG: 2-C-methyl-D-erythritol 4-phosphate cytidylyltransferase [Cyclobacteriaceae bacterium]|nr:2-C-methyl-D-erythritol 4-phosphate cytidylyltransferase [Cyclobacteriaceae bacterium]